MKKQGVTEVKTVTIKKEGKLIETNTYIMTFDQPKILEKIKVGYTMERVEQFIPNPLNCYNCQKYSHHEDNCRGRQVSGKCGQQDPDHHSDNCNNPYKCANCGSDHPVIAVVEMFNFFYAIFFKATNELRNFALTHNSVSSLFAALNIWFVLGAARLVVFRLVGCLRRNGLARC